MVALPTTPNEIPQVRAAKPAVSAADIAAPYASLARTLDKAGEVAEKDIAEPYAVEAGRNAVTIGDDGQPVIAKVPIFGAASPAYMRAAQMTALAQSQPEVESHLTELRLKFPNDPESYRQAAGEYLKTYTAKILDSGLREAVYKLGNDHAEANYRTSLVQADNTNRENALVSLQSRLAGINEQSASIARQGGVDTPEYAKLHADRAAIYNELVSDPRFKFPQAKVDEQLKENRDADVVQATVGEVVRTYKTKANSIEAQRALQDAFWGEGSEKLNLSPQKRDKGVTEGLRALERTGAEDKQAAEAFQSTVTEYTKNLQAAPNSYSDVAHGALLSRAAEIDRTGKLRAELDAAKTMVPLWQAIKGLPPSEANAASASIARGVVPALKTRLHDRDLQATIEAEAARQGVPANLAVTIAQIESGGNPLAQTGSYKGVFQLSAGEFAKYGAGDILDPAANTAAGIASLKAKSDQFRADFGRDPTATELYLAHQQGEAGLRAHLANPDAPAWQNMLSTGEGKQKGAAWAKAAVWGNLPQSAKDMFGSVEKVTSGQFMAAWAQRVQGIPYGDSGLAPGQLAVQMRNPYVAKLFFSTAEKMRIEVGNNAETMAGQISAMAKAGDAIPPDTLQTFVTAAIGSGKENLIEKVKPDLEAYDRAISVQRQGSAATVPALEAQIAQIKATGVDPIRHQMLNSLGAQLKAGSEALQKEPLTEAGRRGWVDPVHPINTANPQAAAAELADRDRKISIVRKTDPSLGPMKAIGDDEAQSFKTALTQGDPKASADLLAALQASLSPENYKATLASKPMAEALDGMIRSYDPVRLNAAMATLDRAWRNDPVGFAQTFKENTTKRLQTWQSWKDSATPAEIVERFKRADDPAFAKARHDLEEIADTENKKMKPDDVAGAIYALDHPILSHVPFFGPSAPSDAFQAQAMKSEFDGVRRELRGMGVDGDQATKQAAQKMKTIYGSSDVNNGDMMRHPPERYYPEIGGSHDWMRAPIEADIEKAIGKPRIGFTRTDLGPRTSTNWTYNLVADSQTEAEIGSGRAPSYQVFVKDADTGMVNAPRDAAGNLMRYRWDPTAPVAASRETFEREHKGAQALTAEQAKQGEFLRNVRESAGR